MRRAWESNLRVSGRLGAAAPGEDGLGAAHPNTHQETEGGARGFGAQDADRIGLANGGARWLLCGMSMHLGAVVIEELGRLALAWLFGCFLPEWFVALFRTRVLSKFQDPVVDDVHGTILGARLLRNTHSETAILSFVGVLGPAALALLPL